MPIPPDPSHLTGTGTLETQFSTWVIVTDQGSILHPVSVPESLQITGLRVRYVVRPRPDQVSPLGAVVEVIEIISIN